MNRKMRVVLLLLLGLLLSSCSQGEAAPAEADPVVVEEPAVEAPAVEAPAVETPAVETPAQEPAPQPTEALVEEPTPEPTEGIVEEPTPEPTKVVVEAEAEPATVEANANGAGARTFQIVSEQSETRFIINEVLFGNDKTVVGVTSEVSGEFKIDPANPAEAQIGIVQINAADLETDDNRRNNSLRRRILQTDQFEFITFEPTAIEGLPQSAAVGDTLEFMVTGDLTIRDVTKQETFAMTVTANAEDELVGFGSTTILYADYGIAIPNVPFVASVEEDVRLEIEFVATAK